MEQKQKINQLLSKLVGKKLLWAGFSEEIETATLIFEGPVGVSLGTDACEEILDVEDYARQVLSEQGDTAKQVIALEQFIPHAEAGNGSGT
jgi:hypothetical protein